MMRLQTFQLPHQRRFFPQRRIFPAQQPREQIQRRRQRPSRLKAQTIVQIPAQRLTEKMPAPIRPRLIQQPENALIRPNQQMLPVVQKRKRIAGHAARPPATRPASYNATSACSTKCAAADNPAQPAPITAILGFFIIIQSGCRKRAVI